jgi:hypothetical protein
VICAKKIKFVCAILQISSHGLLDWCQGFNFAKTQKALRFDALIEREFLQIYKLRRANTAPNNSTH